MLEQVHNLDLLYEKETTTKLLEFKMKYLVSYAQLMRNYFVNIVFSDIVAELDSFDILPENTDLNFLGHKLMIVVCLIVQKSQFPDVLSVQDIKPEEHFEKVKHVL